MGCAGSRFDMVPVTGHPSGLAVIPAGNNGFLRSEPTILKLREKILSWSGDDCSVKVFISYFINITQPMALKAFSRATFFVFWVTLLVDRYLSYLPVKQI